MRSTSSAGRGLVNHHGGHPAQGLVMPEKQDIQRLRRRQQKMRLRPASQVVAIPVAHPHFKAQTSQHGAARRPTDAAQAAVPFDPAPRPFHAGLAMPDGEERMEFRTQRTGMEHPG